MFPRTRIAATCLAVLGLVACSPRPLAAQEGGQKHIVLITVDGLRFDRLKAYAPWYASEAEADSETLATPSLVAHTPNIDRLAANALVYGYALAASAWCAPSTASLLASRYPSELGFTDLVRPLSSDVVTLPEVLRKGGWKTRAIVEHPFLAARNNLDQGFDQYELIENESDRERSRLVVDRALSVIRQMSARPTFLWIELGGLGPPFEVDGYGAPLSREDWLRYRNEWTNEDRAALQQLYKQEVEQLDLHVGSLLDALEEYGLASQTAVVLTASNGAELLEHGMIGDATSLAAALVRVPLLISVSGQHSGAIQDPVSLIDVAPSLLRLVGLSAPAQWRGVSVLPRDPSPNRVLFSELSRARQLRVAVEGDYKLLWNLDTDQLELFEVFSDPFEERDLRDQQGAVRVELMKALKEFAANGSQPGGAD